MKICQGFHLSEEKMNTFGAVQAKFLNSSASSILPLPHKKIRYVRSPVIEPSRQSWTSLNLGGGGGSDEILPS